MILEGQEFDINEDNFEGNSIGNHLRGREVESVSSARKSLKLKVMDVLEAL